ncbi:hypothetical protein AX14_012726 [Amanita brunnescens Koide BX004]|nr:hypothetical protein AX14_012726 [Amanita brunnescens Koide BX004]
MSSDITYHAGSITRAERTAVLNQTGLTIWLTGLSGSGKVCQSAMRNCTLNLDQSTIACALEQYLVRSGKYAYRLDGDNVRFGLNKDLGFDEKSRNENIRRIAEVSSSYSGCITITSFISPYRSDRAGARQLHVKDCIPFVEVFIDAPLEVAESRDPKGLYKKARAGDIQEFTGISSPYEIPETPELHLRTHEMGVDEAVRTIINYLLARDIIYIE